MEEENDSLRMTNIVNVLNYTGIGDKATRRKTFFTIRLAKLVNDIQNKTFIEIIENFDSLEGNGLKVIIPSKLFDIFTRLEVLMGLKLNGHFDTLTEASNLIDDLYKRGEIESEQPYRHSHNKLHTQ